MEYIDHTKLVEINEEILNKINNINILNQNVRGLGKLKKKEISKRFDVRI